MSNPFEGTNPFKNYMERRQRCQAQIISEKTVESLQKYYAKRGEQYRTRIVRQGDVLFFELEWDIAPVGTELGFKGALVVPRGAILVHGVPPYMMDPFEFNAQWEFERQPEPEESW